jgi:hypothetical protein
LAAEAGITAEAMITSLRAALDQDDVNGWAMRLGLSPATLPVDLPGLYGHDPNVDETVRGLLSALKQCRGWSEPFF